jgi:hypothetical protein
MLRFNLKKVLKVWQFKVENRFAALDNLDGNVGYVSRMYQREYRTSAKESLGYHENKHKKPWFD